MIQSDLCIPGTPSVLFFEATLPLKPATIALKIVHLAFQVKFKNWLEVLRYPGLQHLTTLEVHFNLLGVKLS